MSSPEVVQRYITEQEKFGQQNFAKINQIKSLQIQRENELVQSTSSYCPNEQLMNRTLRSENIQEALNFGIGDANILRTLMCVNNSAISFPTQAGFGRNYKIWRYFTQLQQIGGESASGYAFSTGVRSVSDKSNNFDSPFVVKSPRKNLGEARIGPLHEYFVGAFGTNSLRNIIPNFSFVFGYFLCSPPFIGKEYGQKENTALTYCQNLSPDNQVMYLIYENVKNSMTLREFIQRGCSVTDYLNILTQIVLSLNFAYSKIGFSHNDLHVENILVRRLNSPITIRYPLDNNNDKFWNLTVSWVATFIDYGRSIIRYPYQGKEEYFGYALPKYGLYPDRSYPAADLFKICLSSLGAALFRSENRSLYLGKSDSELLAVNAVANPAVFEVIKQILPYFRTSSDPALVAKYVTESSSSYYTFPYYPEYDRPPLHFFQEVLLKLGVINEPNPKSLYGCANGNVCLSLEQAIVKYTLLDDDLISDPYTFWEIVIEQANSKKMDLARELVNNPAIVQSILTPEQYSIGSKFYLTYLNIGLHDLNSEVSRYNQLFSIFSKLVPNTLNYPINPQTSSAIDQYVSLLVQMVNSAWIISQIVKVLAGINLIYPDLAQQRVNNISYQQLVNDLANKYRKLLEFVNPLISRLQQYGAAVSKIELSKFGGNSSLLSLINRLGSLIWSVAPLS